MNLISKILMTIIALLATLLIISPAVFAAEYNDNLEEACQKPGAENSALCQDYRKGQGDSQTENAVIGAIKTVIGILSFAAGALAVIFVIYGGFKYVTSSGDANGVNEAKNIIMYALVGLLVAVIGRFVIIYVLNQLA